MNSLRRNEYGSSPPTRGDSSGYSRGIQGRWDTRSSGRTDRDSDTQSDWDPGEVLDYRKLSGEYQWFIHTSMGMLNYVIQLSFAPSFVVAWKLFL